MPKPIETDSLGDELDASSPRPSQDLRLAVRAALVSSLLLLSCSTVDFCPAIDILDFDLDLASAEIRTDSATPQTSSWPRIRIATTTTRITTTARSTPMARRPAST